jgi:polysaccharide pyruvyl transferase WcaK-like protein
MRGSNGAGAAFRVVLEPSGHQMRNHGDAAMLRVALRRIRELWPDASVGVICSDPAELRQVAPDAEAIPAGGRYELIDRGPALASRRDLVLGAAEAANLATAQRALRAPLTDEGHAYLTALAEADLFLASGRGGVCDAFWPETLHLLEEIELVSDLGVPIAMMGQGLGPIANSALHARAAEVIPKVGFLALREGRASPALARSLGFPDERTQVTGDDALELVLDVGATRRARAGLGVNLRVSDYAAVDDSDVDRVGSAVRNLAGELSTELVPIPISTYEHESDLATAERLIGTLLPGGAEVHDIELAIRRASACRVLVTGSYHAGLFALAQGVPVVALARSGYYEDKLLGLAHQFGGGVTVISLDAADLEERIASAVRDWWDAPGDTLDRLPRAARHQVELGRHAWARLPDLVANGRAAPRARRRRFGGGRGMVVSRLETRELDDAVEHSALFRWPGDERRVSIATPPELAGDPDDASPFLPLALLPAMQRRDDVVIDGPVSPRLVRGAREAVELYAAWAPELRPAAIEVAEERVPDDDASDVACFYSRGVDSTYSAAVPRSHPGPLDRLLFIDGFDPNLGEGTMAEEIRSATATAARLDLPLSVVRTNVHDLTRLFVSNWADMVGAALAFVALGAARSGRAVVIPSSDSAATMCPTGTSPALDPLFSTETTEVVHDSVALGRVRKGLWLGRERPDLLPELKVCFSLDSADNCGRCRKCLLTMASLRAVGALRAASRFPSEIDLDAVRTMPIDTVMLRVEVLELVRELDDGRDPELRAALVDSLEQPMWTYPGPPPSQDTPGFSVRYDATLVAVLRDRTVWPPPAGAAPPGLGLVRAIDRSGGRHVYGVGRLPAGELVGELGSLPREPAAGLDSVYITAGGHVVTDASARPPVGPRPAVAARWALAPLLWRRSGIDLATRGRAAAARGRMLIARRRRPARDPVARVASIHRHPFSGRVPIFSAIHPVTGDQLLTTNEWEPRDLGYGEAELLGYADGQAPLTGRLHLERRDLPWASHLGRRVR